LFIAVFSIGHWEIDVLAFFVIVSKIFSKPRFLIAFRFRVALPVVSYSTELGYDFGLLSDKRRLREVTFPFGLVTIVTLLIVFLALFGGANSIEDKIGF
jgi:hypothetical protein